ncbi:MAG: sodium:proton antiporter [Alphaproteobacteria bacterium]|nr:sodium:proton antiporter [Alphaproteobacteria bacterium]
MTWQALPPLVILFSSLLPGLAIFFVRDDRVRLRTTLNLAGALIKLMTVAVVIAGIRYGWRFEARVEALPHGVDLVLRIDALSMLFVALSSVLWLITTIYAIGYLEGAPHRSRFFGFFSICVSATVGIAMAGNLFTFLVFYELLTLSTYPLIVHRGTDKARAAGAAYLLYSVPAGAVLLVAVIWLHTLAGPVEFAEQGGALGRVAAEHRPALGTIFILLVAGLGAKAALVPLHGWLPKAMVAPAPVSALLHAVAVVKAGAFGIVRVVYDVYGVDLANRLGAMDVLAIWAAVTILYGSVRALGQDDLKRRLAFSTISQVSYIVLGVALFGPIATIGGLTHLVHQGVMKITLFFCAGNIAETHGLHRVSELSGIGRRMPWTMMAFSIAALGMIGLPPLAGFVSKWYLGTGALAAGQPWAVAVLMASSLLNAAYFLPILHRAWLCPSPAGAPAGEARKALLWPTLGTMASVVVLGVFANAPISPTSWARFIAGLEYGEGGTATGFLAGLRWDTAFAVDDLAAFLLPAMAAIAALAAIRLRADEAWSPAMAVALAGTLAGALGCAVAVHPLAYYTAFSVMTIASYPLVVSTGTDEAHRAGRLYLGLAMAGEMLALAGLMAWSNGAEGGLASLVILIGLGAKLGVPPFHVALAPAYQAAPSGAAAIIGGVLSSAAAIGWLRFLPQSGWPAAEHGGAIMVAGVAMALTGAALGCLQRRPAALLGYSTMSQMGILLTAMAAAPASLVPAFFVLHHGLVKAAMLLSLAARGGGLTMPLLALSLAGAPLTGGALAKMGIEHHAPGWLAAALPLTSFATTLMLGRLLWLRRSLATTVPAPVPALATLTALAAPMIYAAFRLPDILTAAAAMDGIAHTVPPVASGVVAVAVAWIGARRGARLPITVPEGDIAAIASLKAVRTIAAGLTSRVTDLLSASLPRSDGGRWAKALRYEALLRNPQVTGSAFFLFWLAFLLLLLLPTLCRRVSWQ